MGKKYLETKKDSLESSILGVWQNAIEEGDARMDGRTKGYKSHRAKLETNRQRREAKKLNKEEVELDEAFIAEIKEEISELDALIKELDEGILGNIAKAAGKSVVKGVKTGVKKAAGKVKKKIGGSMIGKAFGKVKSGIKKTKAVGGKIKTAVKTGKAYGDEYDPMLERLEIIETKLNDYYKILENAEFDQLAEASGDKEAYKKFFNAALKKFKVGSPAELKGDDKKKFFDYIDKNWEGDNEKAEAAMSQVREFKVQSMKAALAKVWGIDEHKGTKPHKHPHEENEKEVVKDGKTLTGKKAAKIDLNPEIKEAYKPVKNNHSDVKVTLSDREVDDVEKFILNSPEYNDGEIEDVDMDQVTGGGQAFKGKGDVFIRGEGAGSLGVDLQKKFGRKIKVMGSR